MGEAKKYLPNIRHVSFGTIHTCVGIEFVASDAILSNANRKLRLDQQFSWILHLSSRTTRIGFVSPITDDARLLNSVARCQRIKIHGCWTVRKCAAFGSTGLSNWLVDDICPAFMDCVMQTETNKQHTQKVDRGQVTWNHKEGTKQISSKWYSLELGQPKIGARWNLHQTTIQMMNGISR